MPAAFALLYSTITGASRRSPIDFMPVAPASCSTSRRKVEVNHVASGQRSRRDVVECPSRAARRVWRLAFARTFSRAVEHLGFPAGISVDEHARCRWVFRALRARAVRDADIEGISRPAQRADA